VKDYERLVKTLADISAWLEPVCMEARTFTDSIMVSKSLVALFVHIIEFWAKAYAIYSPQKRSTLFGGFRCIWTDYDEEHESLRKASSMI
jgi:hypothetical protein